MPKEDELSKVRKAIDSIDDQILSLLSERAELAISAGKTKTDSELFRLSLARRMRLPLLSAPALCPLCGTCLGIYMDHALVCSCGGDRTLCHNAIRDCFFDLGKELLL